MDKLIDDIRKDRKAGTPGPFKETTDHDWVLDTEGESAYFVIAGAGGKPVFVAAVESAFGFDDRNQADARRLCRIDDMEARILADAEALKAADALADLVDRDWSNETSETFRAMRRALAAYRQAREGSHSQP
jgi:hypothetical protein